MSELETPSGSEWIGEVGERLGPLTLTVQNVRFLDTDYGVKTLVTYHDEAGNVVRWFASGELDPPPEGTGVYEATIKEHAVFNGQPETHVLRVSPYFTPEEKKARAAAKRAAKNEYTVLQTLCDEAWDKRACGAEEADRKYNIARDAALEAYRKWQEI
jgi:hypothetical protein